MWGTVLAAVTSILSAVAFAFLFAPPIGSVRARDSGELAALAVFLATGVVVGELAARLRRQAQRSAGLSEEQLALRRVATLVAQAGQPSVVFEAVTREVALLCEADLARMERYEADGTVVGVAVWGRVPAELAVGTRFDLNGVSIARGVKQSGGPVRVDRFGEDSGAIAREARAVGIRASVGCPIVVGGRLWGVIAASRSSEQPFPAGTEAQIGEFTELVATAVANAQARQELQRVAEEAGRLLPADQTALVRCEADDTATAVAGWSASGDRVPVGRRLPLPETGVSRVVRESGRLARINYSSKDADAVAASVFQRGIRSSVGAPITVEGRLWGVMHASWSGEAGLPVGTEARLAAFTGLVATAIANAQAHAELTASRARIVAAADQTRRRIERDLHDGAQQRLVSLALRLRTAAAAIPPELDEVHQELAGVGLSWTGC
jgi:GAF domain-containing protein